MGSREKGHRILDIEQFRCLEIYEKQEFGGLLNRKLGRFSAFENSIDGDNENRVSIAPGRRQSRKLVKTTRADEVIE